ncbi:MAG: anthranilate synthase component I family protein [Nitrospirae bacterium]|nr:anthranilate synthase component I family protein [Nitrospirota bacterium]
MIYPSKNDFLELVKQGQIPPIYKEISYADPQDIYSILKEINSILFQSIKGPFNISRYSFICFQPYLILKVERSQTIVESKSRKSISNKNPILRLRELVTAYQQRPIDSLPPFQGGAAGFLSYDYVRYLEDIPCSGIKDIDIPDAHFLMIDRLISFDHKEKKAWIICCPGARDNYFGFNEIDVEWNDKYFKTSELINDIENKIKKGLSFKDSNPSIPKKENNIEIKHLTTRSDYIYMVKAALEYIKAGDIFQANLSQRVGADISDTDPWEIYKTLSVINPSPFACYLDFGGYQIVSSSPERLVKVERGSPSIVETRPIAGTRPRGGTENEDMAMRKELLLNEKERAEHIMLIDLERNDIGRVCEYGSVKVDELMITELYSHVIHIVSNVIGQLKSDKDCFDTLEAVFPGGTITGVPKVRCMEIIDELEPVLRGPYTGSAGYIGFSKDMDFNIIIRTFLIKDKMAYVQAGAGIVADSNPEAEYYESLKKAEALVKTLKSI